MQRFCPRCNNLDERLQKSNERRAGLLLQITKDFKGILSPDMVQHVEDEANEILAFIGLKPKLQE
jgi:hypothetical protein